MATLENDDEHVEWLDCQKKWIWNFPDDASQMSMGIIRMPQNDPMMARPHGHPLLSLGEMADWNREATVRPGGNSLPKSNLCFSPAFSEEEEKKFRTNCQLQQF